MLPKSRRLIRMTNESNGLQGVKGFFSSLLILLCHKALVRLDNLCVRVEILTRGGGLRVSNPNRKAAKRGLPPTLKPSPWPLVMPIVPRRFAPIARACCFLAIVRASSQWRRVWNLDGYARLISRYTIS